MASNPKMFNEMRYILLKKIDYNSNELINSLLYGSRQMDSNKILFYITKEGLWIVTEI